VITDCNNYYVKSRSVSAWSRAVVPSDESEAMKPRIVVRWMYEDFWYWNKNIGGWRRLKNFGGDCMSETWSILNWWQ
jgi:hypothetical protein